MTTSNPSGAMAARITKNMRIALVLIVVIVFILLGAMDLAAGGWRTGTASVLLAFVNGLLLWSTS